MKETNDVRTHGLSGTPFYNMHQNMIQRCYNPNHPEFKYYGGKGIKVCDRWLGDEGFLNFKGDLYGLYKTRELIGKKYYPNNNAFNSIDRINVDDDYCPENVAIASMKTQANNKTTTKEFIGYHPEEGLFYIRGAKNFAEENHLNSSCISKCLSGKQKIHKGWIFYYPSDVMAPVISWVLGYGPGSLLIQNEDEILEKYKQSQNKD